MPKIQETTQSDINYATEAIASILSNICIEEVDGILERVAEWRNRERNLDVDISESEEEEEDEDRDDTWSENGSTTSEEYPSP